MAVPDEVASRPSAVGSDAEGGTTSFAPILTTLQTNNVDASVAMNARSHRAQSVLHREKIALEEKWRQQCRVAKKLRVQLASLIQVFRAISEFSHVESNNVDYLQNCGDIIDLTDASTSTPIRPTFSSTDMCNDERLTEETGIPRLTGDSMVPRVMAAILRGKLVIAPSVKKAVESVVAMKLSEQDAHRELYQIKTKLFQQQSIMERFNSYEMTSQQRYSGSSPWGTTQRGCSTARGASTYQPPLWHNSPTTPPCYDRRQIPGDYQSEVGSVTTTYDGRRPHWHSHHHMKQQHSHHHHHHSLIPESPMYLSTGGAADIIDTGSSRGPSRYQHSDAGPASRFHRTPSYSNPRASGLHGLSENLAMPPDTALHSSLGVLRNQYPRDMQTSTSGAVIEGSGALMAGDSHQQQQQHARIFQHSRSITMGGVAHQNPGQMQQQQQQQMSPRDTHHHHSIHTATTPEKTKRLTTFGTIVKTLWSGGTKHTSGKKISSKRQNESPSIKDESFVNDDRDYSHYRQKTCGGFDHGELRAWRG